MKFNKKTAAQMLKSGPQPHVSSEGLIKSYIISLLISLPCLAISIYVTQFHINWIYPQTIFMVIMFISVLNFVTLILLDEIKGKVKVGTMTVPMLLAAAGLVLLFLIIEGINRFMPILSYRWLFPVIALVMAVKYLAMFKEKNLALKFYLGANIIVLSILWSLGETDKIVLPF